MSLTIEEREHYVATRFDTLQERFKSDVPHDDYRLTAVIRALGAIEGKRILDLGCGKGRFAKHLVGLGAEVIGLDVSSSMIGRASALTRVQGSARRLPFRDRTFDAVIAIEVFEHLIDVDGALDEARRVLRDGGIIAVVDKNLCSLNRQRWVIPNLMIKWADELRGRWMYPLGAPVRERWFWPIRFKRRLAVRFDRVAIEYLLSDAEAPIALFKWLPVLRLMVLWTGKPSEGGRS